MSFRYVIDLNNNTTLRTGYASQPFRTSSRRLTSLPYPTRAGGATVVLPPGPLTIPLAGFVLGEASTLAYRSARDSLLAALSQTRQRLYADFADDRFLVATPTNIETSLDGPRHGTWSADFVSDDAYFQAATPSADVRTPMLAATYAAGQYVTQFALAPGGTAQAPMRAVIANLAGGVTPTRWRLANLSTGEAITTTTAVAANSVLVLDQAGQYLALVSPMTNIVGWWPFEDASGNALGFGLSQRALTANGSPTYRQDGWYGAGMGFDGSTAFFASSHADYGLTTTLTVGAWVKADVASTAIGIIGKAESTKGYGIRRTAGNVFEGGIANVTSRTATGTRTVVVGEWYHVVMTLTGGTVTLYVNGDVEAVTGGGAFSPSVAANDLRVGAPHNLSGSAEFWDGTIDEPFVASDCWTATRVKTAFRHGVAAVHGSPVVAVGAMPSLSPLAGTTNVLELRADNATLPTISSALSWRSRFQ